MGIQSKTNEIFISELSKYNSQYKSGEIKILSAYERSDIKIKAVDKYGEIEMMPQSMLINSHSSIKVAVDKNKYFLEMLKDRNKHYCNGNFTVLSVYSDNCKICYVKTEFGICKTSFFNILQGKTPTVKSAVYPLNFWKNKIIKRFGYKYNYNDCELDGDELKNILCRHHGYFRQSVHSHYQGHGCKKCSGNYQHSLEEYKESCAYKHNNFYDYSLVQEKDLGKNNMLNFLCPLHGIFKQRQNAHLYGHGCNKCSLKKRSENLKINNRGWAYSRWIESAEKSKNFDSFKVYIIRCWNEEEEFYKIGKTFCTIENRFKRDRTMVNNYNYEIIYTEESNDGRYISELENNLLNQNNTEKYKPKIKFGGYSECFSKITN